MHELNAAEYAVDAREVDRRERLERVPQQFKGKGSTPDGAPEFMNVSGQINLLSNDMDQLSKEICELRAALAPVLKEMDNKQPRREFCSVRSGMAAELGAIHMTLCDARQTVELTLLQLDL